MHWFKNRFLQTMYMIITINFSQKVIVNFQENAIHNSIKHMFSRISGRVLWPLVSKSLIQNCINSKRPYSLTWWEIQKRKKMGPHSSGPRSPCRSWLCPPPCWHHLKLSTKAPAFAAHICAFGGSEHWRMLLLENLSHVVRKNIPNKCLLISCLTAILSPLDHVEFHELFFCLRDWKPEFILKPLSLGKEEIYYIRGSLFIEEIVNLSTTASPAQLFRQAHKAPEELFPHPSLWSSQVSPPSGNSREESEHLSFLFKRQPAFMDVH